MKYFCQIFQEKIKGTSIDWEVIYEHFYDALNKVKKMAVM